MDSPIGQPMAIVAASFTFPGGVDRLDRLADVLLSASPQVAALPDGPRHRSWVSAPRAAWLAGIEDFDPAPFGLSVGEATLLDPRHRLLLMHARRALHQADVLDQPEGIGVFLGLGGSEYRDLCPAGDPRVAMGTESSTAAGRIAHTFGLGGPAMVIDTACSSFLVALHQARQALLVGDCDVALVGAAQLIGSPAGWERLERTGILSSSSRCRPLSAEADGTVRGEGGGVVVLRRGTEGIGVIRGTAIGHDGAAAGLTVPHGPSQERVIRRALAQAGLDPEQIGLLEGHLTGTALGDPIEVQALREVFGARSVPLTAAKGVFGHLEAAAGLVGLLSALAMLRARRVAPVAGLEARNAKLPEDGPQAVSVPTPLPAGTGAGISSFGLSGTNAHAVIEAGAQPEPEDPQLAWQPVPLWVTGPSAGTEPAVTAPLDVKGAVAALLGIDPERVATQRSLFELGLDSVGAADLAHRLSVPVATIFEHPTIASLEARTPRAPRAPRSSSRPQSQAVAIVAAACRFPGGVDDLPSYYALLASERDVVGPAPPDRGVSGEGGFLDDVFGFDPGAFGLSDHEAEVMDPQQRLWIEVAGEVLQRAGVPEDLLQRTGLFVGAAESQYLRDWERPDVGVGNEGSFVAGRSAHVLGLGGPVMTLNTACSASLVALHQACRAVAEGECDAAIAGGVSLLLSQAAMQMLGSLGVLSPTGRCRTFSDDADGYVRGEGAGAVLVMRLDEAVDQGHEVLAVVRGSAVAHDGRTGGVAVPGARAWRDVVAQALARAGVSGGDVGYVEAHGSATKLGDAIEARTLHEALAEAGRSGPVWTGSAKSRLGHLEQAAGMAGLLKVLVMLQHGERLPNLHHRKPSTELPRGAVRVPTRVQPWDGPRTAGISAFGIAGTAAHVIVSAPPLLPERPSHVSAHWLALSAPTPEALTGLAENLQASLQQGIAPEDLARSLAVRARADVRAVVVAPGDVLEAVLDGVVPVRGEVPKIGWVFPGAGPHRAAMGAGLAGLPEWLDEHEAVVEPVLGPGLRAVLLDHDDRISDIAWTVVATVALELFLTDRLREWGLAPHAVAGHSFGEIAAAAAAGVLSTRDALRLAALRGHRMREVPAAGTMVVVRADEDHVRAHLSDEVSVAAANSPEETVLSGPREALERVVGALEVDCRWLSVDRAWHSAAVAPVVDAFAHDVRELGWHEPELPLVTGLDGALAGARATDPAHWGALLRGTVQWRNTVQGLADAGCDAYLELGPHPTLLASVGSTAEVAPERLIGTLHREHGPDDALREAAARLWAIGAPVAPAEHVSGGRIVNDVPVPPLQRRDLRVERQSAVAGWAVPTYELSWAPATVGAPPEGRWAVLGSGSLAQDLTEALRSAGVEVVRNLEQVRGVVIAPGSAAPEPAVQEAVAAVQAVPTDVPVVLASRGAPGALQGVGRALTWERSGVCTVSFAAEAPVQVTGWELSELHWTEAGEPQKPRPARVPAPAMPAEVSGTWVVIGGFGALGRGVAERLVALGADRVVVAGPRVRPVPAPLEPRTLAAESADGLRALLEELGAVEGVVLAAGVLDDALVDDLTPERVRHVLTPKVGGVRALEAAAAHVPNWLLMSSASGWVGSPGQVAYSAANAVLDGAAQRRRASGAHACAVALGPVAGAGLAHAQGADLAAQQAELGVRSMSVSDAVEAVLRGLDPAAPAQLGAFDVDWARIQGRTAAAAPEGPQDVQEVIMTLARRYVRRPIPDARTDLAELGLDSLGAVSLRNALVERGISLPVAVLLRGPSVSDLAAEVRGHAPAEQEPDHTDEELSASMPAVAITLSVLTMAAAVALLLVHS